VCDGRYDAVERPAGPDLYNANTLYPVDSYYAVLQTRGDERALIAAAQRALLEIDPSLPVFDVQTMQDRVNVALSRTRFVTTLLGAFALLALVIAGIGVYGVASHMVGARVREIGIRMALGARRSRVLRDILLDSSRVSAAALVIGVPAALAANRVLSSMLYGVTPHDAVTIAGVAALVVVSALIASWQPARRAARTDPMAVLRHD
jgi:ABC-type antimicrobial peptide transport system permease subunit